MLTFPAVAPSTLTLVTVLKLFLVRTVDAFCPKITSDWLAPLASVPFIVNEQLLRDA